MIIIVSFFIILFLQVNTTTRVIIKYKYDKIHSLLYGKSIHKIIFRVKRSLSVTAGLFFLLIVFMYTIFNMVHNSTLISIIYMKNIGLVMMQAVHREACCNRCLVCFYGCCLQLTYFEFSFPISSSNFVNVAFLCEEVKIKYFCASQCLSFN